MSESTTKRNRLETAVNEETTGSILVVEDQAAMCELIETILGMVGHQVKWVQSADAAMIELGKQEFDLVLTDVRMPGRDGLDLCREIHELRPKLPVIVMTAFGNMETAVTALRSGAYDFVTKPFEKDVLAAAVGRAVNHSRMQDRLRILEDQIDQTASFGDMIGQSQSMLTLYDQLERVSKSDASILITGESGTGKEVVARSVHESSTRRDKPFVAVNCAALSETLLESELFGHAKGAFTDAREARRGLIAEADGGTLLLDEIGDMPLSLQVKLLRALEDSRIRPVGSNSEFEVDVRVLTATHRDLEAAIDEGRFREDLYFRINVIQINLPPLRARGTDVLLIANHFVGTFASKINRAIDGIDEAAAEKLLRYNWPGNIRELRNVIERAVALTRFDRIAVEDLPEKIRDHRPRDVFIGGEDPDELQSLEEIERRYIDHVLTVVNNNKTVAAGILGVDRKTLYRKLKEQDSGPSS